MRCSGRWWNAGLVVLGVATLACGSSETSEPPAAPAATAVPATPRAALADAPAPGSGDGTAEILSPVFYVTRKYGSMEGPSHLQQVSLVEEVSGEPLWITGYRVTVVDADGSSPERSEFLCHNNLDVDPGAHSRAFGWSEERMPEAGTRNRLFTLSQGQFGFELPEGFGVPVVANEPLVLATQVLNHNIENPDAAVRHRIEIDWVRDSELLEPLRPLYASPVQVLVALDGDAVAYGIENPDPIHEAASCSPGMQAPNSQGVAEWTDPLGRRFTGHWVVPPGRDERHTLVTPQLNLTFDTTVHAIGVHVHPFLESLALRDLTRDETVWEADARPAEEGIGLAEVDFYSSAEGIPLYQDHEYELVSVYENTSGVDQDAMAVMFLYLYDSETEARLPYLRQRAEWAAGAE